MTEPTITTTVYARTDLGKTREINEDTFLVADLSSGESRIESELAECHVGPRGLLFLVADGMGGAAAGELASAMAADLIYGHMIGTWTKEPAEEVSEKRFTLRLREAVDLANLQIHTYAREHPDLRGMGTTATVAGVFGTSLYFAQVGDSRGYIVRHGKAVQLTKDQSLTQRLVDAGEMTEEQAETSARRNIILQALGPDAKISVELSYEELRRGDTLVLCSDGLSGLVKRDEIASMIEVQPDLEKLGMELIALANARGGPDNITVVLARFDGDALQPADEAGPEYHKYLTSSDREELAVAPVPAPFTPAVPPEQRMGSPTGMALLVIGSIVVLLALFFALV